MLTRSVFEIRFVCVHVSDAPWRGLLGSQQSAGMTTITTPGGEDLAVHVASVAAILPGFHVAACAAAESHRRKDATGYDNA